jgi:hypothetical protein
MSLLFLGSCYLMSRDSDAWGPESPKEWPAAPVAALGGNRGALKARLNGNTLEFDLSVAERQEEASHAALCARGLRVRFLDGEGEPVVSSRVPTHGIEIGRAGDGRVGSLRLRGVEPCDRSAWRRIECWELVEVAR